MNTPVYVPIFRLRQQEKDVFTSFKFGSDIYPYIEIFKEKPRKSPVPKLGTKAKPKKQFNEVYLPILNSIKSDKIFIDLPVHLKRSRKMKEEVIEFLLGVVEKRNVRTEYLLSLSSCDKIIPVISTYSQISGEPNTIKLQEFDLRPIYSSLAFRTSERTFLNDMLQIKAVAQPGDYLFVDFEEICLSNSDDLDIVQFMIDGLKDFNKCHVVIINSPIARTITNSGLDHGQVIDYVCNSLMDKFESFGGDGFSDYVGVKKDIVEEGGGISPGLIFYDAVENAFYGYRGRDRKKLEKGNLDDFREIIIRDLLASEAVSRMQKSHLDYLGNDNKGWEMINNMWNKTEKWKSQAKFKRIAMERYLCCVKTKIESGYFLF